MLQSAVLAVDSCKTYSFLELNSVCKKQSVSFSIKPTVLLNSFEHDYVKERREKTFSLTHENFS